MKHIAIGFVHFNRALQAAIVREQTQEFPASAICNNSNLSNGNNSQDFSKLAADNTQMDPRFLYRPQPPFYAPILQ